MKDAAVNHVIEKFIEEAGNMTQSLGLGRVVGMLYAYLYFSQEPRNLGDMQEALGISKGSASTVVRQLEQWGAARRVWVRGDRKDYYEAEDWIGGIIRNLVADTVGTRMASYSRLLDRMSGELGDSKLDSEEGFIRERIDHLKRFNSRVQKLWRNPIVQKLVKV